MMKKLLTVVGVIIGLFVIAAILVPIFFDANKYRPQIEKLVEENVNADLDLGKLTLSLWGGLHIEVERLILSEKGTRGAKPIVSFKDFRLEIPISSVFSGRPSITVAVKHPELHVISEADGKLNVSKLSKAAPPGQAPAPGQKSGGGAGGAAALPFELSFHIVDGRLIYADEKKSTKTEVNGFNFDLKKFALNKPFDFDFNSDLDVKQMKDLTLHGPAKLHGTAGVYMGAAGFERLDLETDLDLSGLLVRYSTLLNKAENAPLKVAIKLSTTPKSLKIDKGHLQIEEAAVDCVGTVDNFDAPVLNLSIASTKFVFDNWQKVLGPLKDFDMKGSANFDVKVTGPLANFAMQGKAVAQNVSLQAPGIVPRVTDLNSQLSFSNDTATLSQTSLKMGDSDLAADGTVKNFSKPVITLNVKSNMLDVDSLLPQKTPEQQEADEAAAKQAEAKGGAGEPADAEKTAAGPIAALKKNPTARNLDFTGRASIAKIRVHKADISNLNAEVTFKELVMALKKASAKAFGGSADFSSAIDFKGVEPSYTVAGDVSGMDVNAAITSQMPSIKDTVFGKLNAKFDVAGSGLTKAKVKQALKGKGNFRLDNGSWNSLKALQQLSEKVKGIPGAADKLGNVKISDKFRDLKADFNIGGGHLNIVNLVADLEGANTALTGNGWIDFDMNEDLRLTALVPGSGIPPKLKAPDGRLKIPDIGLRGTLTSPQPNFDDTFKIMASAMGEQAVKEKLGGEAKKALEKIDNPQVKDLLKKLPF